jgi:hypothetical protein
MQRLSASLKPTNQIIECHRGNPFLAEILSISPGTTRSLSTFELDVPGVQWSGSRPEGVLVTQLQNGDWWTVFIEMKSNDYPSRIEHGKHKDSAREGAEKKFIAAIDHFCKSGPSTSGGQIHHQDWANHTDPLPNLPDRNHKIGFVLVFTRTGSMTTAAFRVNYPTALQKAIPTLIVFKSYSSVDPASPCGKPAIVIKIDANELIP